MDLFDKKVLGQSVWHVATDRVNCYDFPVIGLTEKVVAPVARCRWCGRWKPLVNGNVHAHRNLAGGRCRGSNKLGLMSTPASPPKPLPGVLGTYPQQKPREKPRAVGRPANEALSPNVQLEGTEGWLLAFVDASVVGDVGAWAALFIDGSGRKQGLWTGLCEKPSGQVRMDNNYAETFAVMACAELAKRYGRDVVGVTVMTDSVHAQRVLKEDASVARRWQDKAAQATLGALRLGGFLVRVRWMPGHKNGPGHARHNREVDRVARAFARRAALS